MESFGIRCFGNIRLYQMQGKKLENSKERVLYECLQPSWRGVSSRNSRVGAGDMTVKYIGQRVSKEGGQLHGCETARSLLGEAS